MARADSVLMRKAGVERTGDEEECVSVRVGEQLFGISVMIIEDVLRHQPAAHIPLAPPVISGLLNLRGRIVTVMDMRLRLGLMPSTVKRMHVVVEHDNELYSLLVDTVGDVLGLSSDRFEGPPANMEERWKHMVSRVYSLEDELLIVLDIPALLKI